MRYIGNKTKLRGFISGFLDELGLANGRALDAFAGTAAVGAYLKSRGFEVVACDIMMFSYALQRAYIVVDEYPRFERLAEDRCFQRAREQPAFASRVASRFASQADLFRRAPAAARPLEEVLLYLDTWLPERESFVTEHYSAPAEAANGERMYFTRENGARVDAIRHCIEAWREEGLVSEDEFYILLAALVGAADAVANTTGVYAAFVKTWQPNATRPLRLALPPLVVGTGLACEAHLGDINGRVADLGHFDLLYLDPPYNTRQYSGYYHVPEVITLGWFDSVPELRGKTGLIADGHKKSEWSRREGCVPALEQLIERVDADHVLMSYSSEGIIPEREIERVFKSFGVPETYAAVARDYKRYRSDGDSEVRRYAGDRVTERLYYVRLK